MNQFCMLTFWLTLNPLNYGLVNILVNIITGSLHRSGVNQLCRLTFAAAAAQRQQRRQRAAQAVAAAAFRRGGSCASSGPCRGRVHGGGTCGVWQRRRQRWVWRQHWQRWVCRMPRMVLGHAATAVIALQHRHVAVACVVVWAWHVCVPGGVGGG